MKSNLFSRLKNYKSGISKNVFALGMVSFFNDVASEMIYPIVPVFLTATLGAPVAVLGFIEGVAESTASILKLVSGWFSDKIRRRKPFVLLGYSLGAVSKIILWAAASWTMVFTARFIDRFGKGIRTSSRDALISESSECASRGRAFGFHRALDTAGAVVGPLIALLAIKFLSDSLRLIFLLAFIPSCIGILLLIIFVKEKPKEKNPQMPNKSSDEKNPTHLWRDMTYPFKIFILVNSIFAIGNSSDAFLILRAKNLGFTTGALIMLYVLFNLTYAFLSTPAGIVADKIGPKKVILAGFLIFSTIYFLFGLTRSGAALWILFPFYGVYMALTEGVGKAYISNLIPAEKAGSAFGIYQFTVGVCTFFASFIAGILWSHIGGWAPFVMGGVTAGIAAVLFMVL